MKKVFLRSAVVVLALCFVTVGISSATELTFPFPTVGAYYFSATSGSGFATSNGLMPSMWTAGDFITQTYFGGPAIADSAQFNFYGVDTLNGATETWGIYINAVVIGGFVLPDVGGVPSTFYGVGVIPFPAIDGEGTYNYSFVLQNTVPPGDGSAAFGVTPEPGSFILLGSGILGLAGAIRRKLQA
ncbi:MAG TPA: PEP-CTERM sorting domain-containing protein [Candidatus Angelobacter sp.]|jgi:hypothetical protein|nr:PEP-CTERM sorting domain-containing protein [Candidatus Angelobacter sp.]